MVRERERERERQRGGGGGGEKEEEEELQTKINNCHMHANRLLNSNEWLILCMLIRATGIKLEIFPSCILKRFTSKAFLCFGHYVCVCV